MSIDYNGLTRNSWTGTWSPDGDFPIVLSNEVRGGLHTISGASGDQLEDITPQRLQEGMLVYVQTGYGTITSDTFYQYQLLGGESRDPSTGFLPNNPANWIAFTSLVSDAVDIPLEDLNNVTITTPQAGDRIVYNDVSGQWENQQFVDNSSVENLADTNVTAPADGDRLVYNGVSGLWENVQVPTPPLSDLPDIGITAPADNQALIYNSVSGLWENQLITLADTVADVSITTPTNGQFLQYNSTSTNWENVDIVQGTLPPAGAQRAWGYVHQQPTSSDTWTIVHNLGTEDVLTQVFNVSGFQFLPDEIEIVDSNTVVVTFGATMPGKAILMAIV